MTLIEKYGADLFDNPPLLTRDRLEAKLAQRDAIDENFARFSMEFGGGILRRPVMDARTRYLLTIGQFTVTRAYGHLEDAIEGAIGVGVPLHDITESIFLCHVYAGESVLEPGLQVFMRVAGRLGKLDELRVGQVPIGGRERDFEAEKAEWPAGLADDPRSTRIGELFGWPGVSTGLKYRGAHHLGSLENYEALDLEWGQLWESFTYAGMYSRGVFDDKTRLLCTTADCLVLGPAGFSSAKDHMEESLEFGASPREVLELIFMTAYYFGFPLINPARNAFVKFMADHGRLAEIGNPPVKA